MIMSIDLAWGLIMALLIGRAGHDRANMTVGLLLVL